MIRSFSARWLLLLGMVAVARPAVAAPNREPETRPALHAALIADSDLSPPGLIDIASAIVAQSNRVQLVERARVADAFREQRLDRALDATLDAAIGAKAGRQRVELGKVVGADLLVLVHAASLSPEQLAARQQIPKPVEAGADKSHKPDMPSSLQVVVCEPRHGLRLALRTVVRRSVEEDAAEIAATVDEALRRLNSGHDPGRATVVAVPPFTNDDFSYRWDQFKVAYGHVVEQALWDRRGTVVVELAEAHALAGELNAAAAPDIERELPLYLSGSFHNTGVDAGRKVGFTLSLQRGEKVLATADRASLRPEDVAAALRQETNGLLDQVANLPAAKNGAIPVEPRALPDANGPAGLSQSASAEATYLFSRAARARDLGDVESAIPLVEASLLVNPDQPAAEQLAVQLLVGGGYQSPKLEPIDHPDPAPVLRAMARWQRTLEHFERWVRIVGIPEVAKQPEAGALLKRRNTFARAVDLNTLPPLFPGSREIAAPPDVREEMFRLQRYEQDLCRELICSKDAWTKGSSFDLVLPHFVVADQPASAAFALAMEIIDRSRPLCTDVPGLARRVDLLLGRAMDDAALRNRVVPDPAFAREAKVLIDRLQRMPWVEAQQAARDKEPQFARAIIESGIPIEPECYAVTRPTRDAPGFRRLALMTANSAKVATPWKELIVDWFAWPGDGNFDILNTPTGIYRLAGTERVELLFAPPQRSDRIRVLACDGAYVWALQWSAQSSEAVLLAIDPDLAPNAGVRRLSTAGGLPPVLEDKAVGASLEKGRIFLAGYFGRSWWGNARVTGAGIEVNVLHEAREAPPIDLRAALKSADVGFVPLAARTVRDAVGIQRVLLQRSLLSQGVFKPLSPVLADPLTREFRVVALDATDHPLLAAPVAAYGNRFYVRQSTAKMGTAGTVSIVALDQPDLRATVVTPDAPPGELIFTDSRVLIFGKGVWQSGRVQGPFEKITDTMPVETLGGGWFIRRSQLFGVVMIQHLPDGGAACFQLRTTLAPTTLPNLLEPKSAPDQGTLDQKTSH